MRITCENCKNQPSCFRPMRFRFGFCETSFEPKEKAESREGMEWVQLSSTEWEARGKYGVFNVKRTGGKFWARYASSDTAFKMPPKDKLSGAKEMCERNANWEDAG